MSTNDQETKIESSATSSPLQINTFELKEKIATLQEALLSAHPTMPVLLRQIHTQLKADPELVSVLSEEDIGIIVNGIKVHTNTEIVTAVVKQASNSTSLKKKLSGANALDLF